MMVMQPLSMVIHPVMVTQPVSMVLEFSGAVCVFGVQPVMVMQPLTMVIHLVMVMQPVSMVLELSGAVLVYGDVALAFVLCLNYSSTDVKFVCCHIFV